MTDPQIDPLPPCDRTASDFRSQLDAFFLTALPRFSVQVEVVRQWLLSLSAEIAAKLSASSASAQAAAEAAQAAAAAAAAAQGSATSAAIYAGAPRWEPGSYQAGEVRYSPVTQSVYRARIAHVSYAGDTDPSGDPEHWGVVFAGMPMVQTADAVVHAMPGMHYVLSAAAAVAVHLPAAPTLGDTVAVTVANGLTTNHIAAGDNTVMGIDEDMVIDVTDAALHLQWLPQRNGVYTWRIV